MTSQPPSAMSRCLHSEDFTAYCDEFGSPQDTERRTMGVAGLLAPFSKWGEFSSHWEPYLTLEKVPQPFHMKDFVHHSKAFSDARWEKWEERERILTGLVSILHDVHAIPVAASVVLSDYNALTPDQKGRCKSPYHLAFQAVTSNMGFAAASIDLEAKLAKALEAYRQNVELDEKSLAKLTSVSMVYAKLEGYTGSADELWSAIKATNMFGAWMSSYNVKEPKNCPPLQAADIWAYCIGRFGERDRPVVREVEMALSCFFAESQTTKHAAHFFTLLDHGAITARVG